MELQQLIAAVRTWQSLSTKYEAACEEARQINNGMHYPSSPGRRAAIKVLDDADSGMRVCHRCWNGQ